METKEITESEVMEMEVELEVFDEVTAAVEAAKKKCADIILKYDTPQDIKEAKSFIYDIRRLKAPITQAHKMAKAQLLVDGRAMDAKKNMLIGTLEDMIEEKYAPIKIIEDAEKAKKDEEDRIAREQEEAMEAERLAEIEARERAAAEKEAELKAKQEEIERKEREARIVDEAKKRAVIEADNKLFQAEEKAKAELRIAENRRLADVQRAKDEAKAERQAEQIEAERQAEHQRQIKEEREIAETQRINDQTHQGKIHREIYKYLCDLLPEKEARSLTTLLIEKQVPHTRIQY